LLATTGERLLLGVDLGGSAVKYGLITSEGAIVDHGKIPTLVERGPEDILHRIACALDELLARDGRRRTDILAVGFGSPGPLSTQRGVVIDTPNLQWKDVPVQATLEQDLGLPLVLHNDANAAAYGEFWKGAGREAQIMVLYTLGTGVGGGICLNNDLLVGPGENAGELGHMVLDPHGPQCPCGHFGCLEAFSAAKAIVRDMLIAIASGEETSLKAVDQAAITAKRIFEAARDGDAVARRLFHRAGWCLGLASGNLVNVLNAEMFVFGGAMSGAWEILHPAILEGARASAMAMPFEEIKFVRAELGENAGMIGAAGLALRAYGS